MGMFDEIRCEAPLPDGYDASDTWFQSKSFPFCGLCRYTITLGGRLVDQTGNDLEIDGYLIFYTSDPAAPSPSGEPPLGRWREYRARFIDGQLDHIVRVDEQEADDRHYGIASFRWFRPPRAMLGDSDMTSWKLNEDDVGWGE